MKVCIFEDFFISRLAPVNSIRHTSEIICGATSLADKIKIALPKKTEYIFHSRKSIEALCRTNYAAHKVNEFDNSPLLFLNSRILFDQSSLKPILKEAKKDVDFAWIQDKYVVAMYLSGENSIKLSEALLQNDPEQFLVYADVEWLNIKKTEVSGYSFINYTSDLINYNDAELRKDLAVLLPKGKKRVYISIGCKISKQAVLDSSDGDIFVDKDTVIEPFVYIKGPVYIGEHTTIRSGASIYGPVSIGANCKLNGEITCSIIHSYVNKQHHGFLGHSYLCEWVNLGAGTTTSNLKNNYSQITIDVGGHIVKTGSIFLGSIIGDHTKTGINTMLNSGTQIGLSCNLYGGGYQNKIIKPFSWIEAGSDETVYDIEKALFTARTSMKRRNVEMSAEYENLFRNLFAKRSDLPRI